VTPTILVAALLLASPPAESPTPPRAETSRVAAAGWCAIHDSSADPDTISDDTPRSPGCDFGLAASVYDWRRFHLVGVLGAETVGVGLARVVSAEGDSRVIAVALGVVALYDDQGIDMGSTTLALGATLSFRRVEE
jgi:hypothetical protein